MVENILQCNVLSSWIPKVIQKLWTAITILSLFLFCFVLCFHMIWKLIRHLHLRMREEEEKKKILNMQKIQINFNELAHSDFNTYTISHKCDDDIICDLINLFVNTWKYVRWYTTCWPCRQVSYVQYSIRSHETDAVKRLINSKCERKKTSLYWMRYCLLTNNIVNLF